MKRKEIKRKGKARKNRMNTGWKGCRDWRGGKVEHTGEITLTITGRNERKHDKETIEMKTKERRRNEEWIGHNKEKRENNSLNKNTHFEKRLKREKQNQRKA